MIIGISGKIGSGKSTLANILKELDNKFVEKSFAFKLKQIVSIITGTSIEDNLTQDGKKIVIKEFGKSLGEIQQIVGTEAMRNGFDQNVWVKSLFMDYKEDSDFWIISDVRFENEADYVKKMGGILIRLEGDPILVRVNSNRDMNHPSETSLDNYKNFDFVFENENSIEKLTDFAKEIIDKNIYVTLNVKKCQKN